MGAPEPARRSPMCGAQGAGHEALWRRMQQHVTPCPSPQHVPPARAPAPHLMCPCTSCPMKHRPKSTCAHQIVSSSPGRHGVSTRLFRESPLYSSAQEASRVCFRRRESTSNLCRHTLTRVQWTLDSELFLVLTRLSFQYKGHQGPVTESGLSCR